MRKVNISPEGCWIWTVAKIGNGYGQVIRSQKHWLAHRWAYTELVGPIPAGLDLDHLCRVRICCNPSHLEPVTRGENLLRGKRAQEFCYPGKHRWADGNEYFSPRGERRCRSCARERNKIASRERRARAVDGRSVGSANAA